jgi:2',3'-cyclic-nucleotide 2'-phosphodiesterase (5'-nucleotidase family)
MNRTASLVAASLLLVVACAATPVDRPKPDGVTFLHLNDTYRIGAVEDGTAGGFGRVVTVVRELQAEGRDVRILHGGDFLYPSLESQLWDGMQIVEAFNFMDALAPMYVVAGNHEFDPRTAGHLVEAVRASDFDWVGDNYRFETGDAVVDGALHEQFMFEADGRKIGVFGLLLHASEGGNERDYVPTEPDYFAHAERAVSALDAAGADLIIGLTHLHFRTDVEIAALRAKFPQFMFIAGGHEHEPEYSELQDDRAAVVKGASNARRIWRIDVRFDAEAVPSIDARMIDLDESVEPDADYAQIEAKWRNRLLERFPFLVAKIGEAAVPLDAREVTIRNEESNWGNFVVDQMRGAFGKPHAELAFINSGTLRIDDYIIGDIAFEDVGRTFGFSSFLRHMTMTGEQFETVLEAGYRGTGPSKGYFPQVSGFRICVDRSRPEGDRIVSLQVPAGEAWQDVDADRQYSVVVPDFLFRGGDGYDFPTEVEGSRPGSELVYRVLDAIISAQAEGRAIGEPVDPANPRIVILESPGDSCWPD